MLSVSFKRGDTLSLACAYTVGGSPAAVPTSVSAQMRDRFGALIAQLTITMVDQPGGLYVASCAAAATATWPIGLLYCDIEYTDSVGNVASTDTFLIDVKPDVTHA